MRLRRRPRWAVAALILAAVAGGPASAENSLTLIGNYWKERSTRVIEPLVEIRKDLPLQSEIDLTYLVDNVTSASGAFTASDMPFTKYRQEGRIALQKQLDFITPAILLRYSDEPDYTSRLYGAAVQLSLDDGLTVPRVYFQGQNDDVRQRTRPGFHDVLQTILIGGSVTQVFRPDLIGGVTYDFQMLRGFQENPYRNENEPRARDRHAVSVWLDWYAPTGTGVKVTYRFYADDWQLVGHTLALELSQRVLADLEVIPTFRYYTQGGVYFDNLSPDGYVTADPKLFPFDSGLYGLTLRWRQHWLRGTFLEPFAESSVEPFYGYFDQHNSYGPAHIAQLLWYWPF